MRDKSDHDNNKNFEILDESDPYQANLDEDELSKEDIYPEEISGLLDDAYHDEVPIVADEEGDLYYEELGLGDQDMDEDNPNMCDQPDGNEDYYSDMSDRISEPREKVRGSRTRNPLARLNPATGQN